METSALVTHEEVRDWAQDCKDAMICSVSHAWETREHPDPCVFQLENLTNCVSLYDAAYSSAIWVFFDYVSLFQWQRSDEEEFSYQLAMRNLYAHRWSLSLRLELLTPADTWTAALEDSAYTVAAYQGPSTLVRPLPVRDLKENRQVGYHDRGWCRAETEWSATRNAPSQNRVIDRDDEPNEPAIQKKLPMAPEVFSERMASSAFTHRDDAGSVVQLQAKVFHEKVTARRHLMLSDLDKHEVMQLAASLPKYTQLKALSLGRVALGEAEAHALGQAGRACRCFFLCAWGRMLLLGMHVMECRVLYHTNQKAYRL